MIDIAWCDLRRVRKAAVKEAHERHDAEFAALSNRPSQRELQCVTEGASRAGEFCEELLAWHIRVVQSY